MSALAKKQTAPALRARAAEVQENNQHSFRIPTPAELQERHTDALEIVADQREELQRRQRWLHLQYELIGGVTDEEVERLTADFDRLHRCMKVLAWRVGE